MFGRREREWERERDFRELALMRRRGVVGRRERDEARGRGSEGVDMLGGEREEWKVTERVSGRRSRERES